MLVNQTISNGLAASVRSIVAKVELYNSSTLVATYKHNDRLISFEVDRVGESNLFFGFGTAQRINIKLRDVERELSITTANSFKVYLGFGSTYVSNMPTFYVTEVNRDENTNELSITAYDKIYFSTEKTVADLTLSESYTVQQFANACATLLGLTLKIEGVGSTETCFSTAYTEGANFEGTETIREALNAVAQVTQTIYFINNSGQLVFKRLSPSASPVLTIGKANYIELDSKTNKRLTALVSATDLGDNVEASLSQSGSTQYIYNNPFWELREDVQTLLNNALAAVGGLTINQFECNWRGNFLTEFGDKIALTTKDNNTVNAFLINDSFTYDGAFSQKSQWDYDESNDGENTNPTSLGEALRQTYARVDKANKQIDILTSQTDVNRDDIANLHLSVDNIAANVEQVQRNYEGELEAINDDLSTLTNSVNAKMTAQEVEIKINQTLENGVSKVETSTGYTLDDEGLTVQKSGSEMKTQITDDGMKVYRDENEVLTANNRGVDAENLHATTYLIIGNNSRIEDYQGDRTACYYVGGGN